MSDFENENEADWGLPTETHSTEHAASDNMKDAGQLADDSEWIKVEGNVVANWRGTSGCCDQSRVDSEWASAIHAFVERQKAAHSTLTYVTHGWGQASGQCRRWEDWPNGRRCNGSLSGPAYVYFEQAS